MLQLKKPLFAVGVYVIGNRRAAERNRFAQDLAHRFAQLAELRARNRRRSPAGTKARSKQRLICINISDAAQQLLIQERALDWSLPPVKKFNESFFVQIQRLNASRIKRGMNAKLAKHPRIDKTQFASRRQGCNQVRMPGNFSSRLANHHPPSHPQMHYPLRRGTILRRSIRSCVLDRSAGVPPAVSGACPELVEGVSRPRVADQPEHNVLAGSVHAGNARAFQRPGYLRRRRLQRLRPRSNPDRRNRVANHAPRQAAHNRFYFRELRHEFRIPRVILKDLAAGLSKRSASGLTASNRARKAAVGLTVS